MAAGSVMNEPSTGPMVRMVNHHAAGRLAAERGHPLQRALREHHDRPAGGNRHDHDHEHRLGEIDGVGEVGLGGVPVDGGRDGGQQRQHPQAEHHLDLTEEVQDLGLEAGAGRFAAFPALVVEGVLRVVRRLPEVVGEERVQSPPGRRWPSPRALMGCCATRDDSTSRSDPPTGSRYWSRGRGNVGASANGVLHRMNYRLESEM
jgi:hypothetical protein